MSDIAIRVENLSKLYHIGRARQRHDTLRDALSAALHPASRAARREDETLWALRDVSLEVQRGEVVGIIGRNGAGKSTLLKILSRITEPTSGRAEIHGRVGSLLEVGTGFHPELTGRENVYLNGAILGMHRTEIDRKFDEIVAFAEIEKFLDTPVKHYSSGMYVRLAFAVAAHLDPEILLVDEVLAVGDAAFQRKCLGKMGDVAGEGRTILFVSHNIGAVRDLCERSAYFADGRIVFDGDSHEAIANYVTDTSDESSNTTHNFPVNSDCGRLRVTDVKLETQAADYVITVEVEVDQCLQELGLGYEIRGQQEELVTSQGAIHSGAYAHNVIGKNRLTLRIIDLLNVLTGGDYLASIWLSRPGGYTYVRLQNIHRFSIAPAQSPRGTRGMTATKNGPIYVATDFIATKNCNDQV